MEAELMQEESNNASPQPGAVGHWSAAGDDAAACVSGLHSFKGPSFLCALLTCGHGNEGMRVMDRSTGQSAAGTCSQKGLILFTCDPPPTKKNKNAHLLL